MLKNPFLHLVGQKESLKTYDLIRLQAKTHRFMKTVINDALSKEKLSSLEWGILGLLYENTDGLRYIELAEKMGVEPPFITELVSTLSKRHIIRTRDSETDKRSKVVTLTERGKKQVEAQEKLLEEELLTRFTDISSSDLKTYKDVMNKIILTTEKQN